jgi:ribosomal protein S18 acetylase RimI-like enzyme
MSYVVRLKQTDKAYFKDVAKLHCNEITGGVLSILGEEFLAVLYRYISVAPQCGVWISHDRGNLKGFISGCAHDKKMFRWVLLHGLFPLVAVGLKSITRPGVIAGAISVVKVLLNSNQDEPTPRSQLLSLAVNPKSRNEGIGKSLVRELETELGVWGINECLVWTTQSNLRAIAFYESNGFTKSFVVQHSTENMVGLLKIQGTSKA